MMYKRNVVGDAGTRKNVTGLVPPSLTMLLDGSVSFNRNADELCSHLAGNAGPWLSGGVTGIATG